jgi:hypothetical protein
MERVHGLGHLVAPEVLAGTDSGRISQNLTALKLLAGIVDQHP